MLSLFDESDLLPHDWQLVVLSSDTPIEITLLEIDTSGFSTVIFASVMIGILIIGCVCWFLRKLSSDTGSNDAYRRVQN